MEETKILIKMNHRNIVKCFGHKICDGNNLQIVMESCDGTLDDLMKSSKELDLSEVAQFARQIYQALEYIHSRNIIHRYE